MVAVLNTVFDDNGTSTTDDDVVVQYLNVDKQPFKIAVLNLVELPLLVKADFQILVAGKALLECPLYTQKRPLS